MSLPHLVIFSNFAMYTYWYKTFDKMFNVIFHDVTYIYIMHLSLNFTPKQRNSDYLLHGRWEIGGSVGTANKKQVFF